MKRNLRIIACILVCMLMLGVIAACAEDTAPVTPDPDTPDVTTSPVVADTGEGHAVFASASELRVGFAIKNMHNPYLIAMNRTMDEMAEYFGYELITINAGGDAAQQQMDVEDLIAAGVDVIVMDAQDPIAAIAKSQYIASHNIPLFLLNASVDPQTIFVTLVQSNNVGLGTAVGEWVADQVSGDINIGLLAGNPGNMVGYARRTGFITGLTERQLERFNSTNFTVRTMGWGNWSAEVGMEAAEDMLVAAPDINVIFAENDGMAMGAITAVRNAGREGEVLIVGVDGMADALELIQEGVYGATGVNSPIELVRMAMQIMVDYMTGVNRSIPSIINTTPGLVNAANVEDSWDLAF